MLLDTYSLSISAACKLAACLPGYGVANDKLGMLSQVPRSGTEAILKIFLGTDIDGTGHISILRPAIEEIVHAFSKRAPARCLCVLGASSQIWGDDQTLPARCAAK